MFPVEILYNLEQCQFKLEVALRWKDLVHWITWNSVSDNLCTEISRKSVPIFDLILNIRFEINNFVSNRIEFEALDDLWLS